jgi:hypothetical protein
MLQLLWSQEDAPVKPPVAEPIDAQAPGRAGCRKVIPFPNDRKSYRWKAQDSRKLQENGREHTKNDAGGVHPVT